MLHRLWWFVVGALAGAVVVLRASSRKVTLEEVREAAVRTGADVLDFTAQAMRPNRVR